MGKFDGWNGSMGVWEYDMIWRGGVSGRGSFAEPLLVFAGTSDVFGRWRGTSDV
jgi:hypothetical protein